MLMRYQAALRSDGDGSADASDLNHPPRAVQWAGNKLRLSSSPGEQVVEQRPYFEKLSSHILQSLL